MISETGIGLVLGLSSMTFAFFTFLTRALLKSNCIKLDCLCCSCERDPTHNINELEMNPVSSEKIM